MMNLNLEELVESILNSANEILTAATVIIALSLLLYNLTRNLRNRIARSSAVVLACVTFAYICDAFISLNPDPIAHAAAFRLQWISIAFVPSALFHLSDALLATTGLPSRGRRRRVVRILYGISLIFTLLGVFTDLIIDIIISNSVSLVAGPVFLIYMLYFVVGCIATFINVNRARQRALSRSTQRRLTYLQAAILTPAFGIFPYSVILSPGEEQQLGILTLVNIGNVVVILMLLFLSYPLSFFGSDRPDRVVKVELLRFLLRGPGTGMLALSVIIFTTQATRILGLSGEDFMPFAVVGSVLFWQWTIALTLPWLEKKLVYGDEDSEQFTRLQDLSDRMLTRTDLLQLIEATLESCCDFLRVNVAFVGVITGQQIDLVKTIGLSEEDIQQDFTELIKLTTSNKLEDDIEYVTWQNYQVIPLYSQRVINGADEYPVIGLFAIQTSQTTLDELDREEEATFRGYVQRTEETLDDLLLQSEVIAALEGLLPQFTMTRTRAGQLEFKPGYQKTRQNELPDEEELYEQVRAALRHYWGGPGITRSRLLDLKVVQKRLDHTDTAIQALRNVIQEAIERQRPEGERSMLGVEWTVYNILDLRFIEGKKVREVTKRLSMSDADFYRKQRLAIEALVDTLIILEQEARESTTSDVPV